MYAPNPAYLQVPYNQTHNYPPQFTQYQNHHQAYQYPEMNQTPKNQPHKMSNTIYPESQPQKVAPPVYY